MKFAEIDSPSVLAREIWRIDRLDELKMLAPKQFSVLFEKIYASCNDIESLWQLGGATNDYLRSRPNSLSVPLLELARRLLSSDDVEARVVGLKLLNRSEASNDEIVSSIVSALHQNDGYESCGGIFESGNLLDRCEVLATPLASGLIQSLIKSLEPLTDEGAEVHSGALYTLERMQKLA